jgi:hypothetical protein
VETPVRVPPPIYIFPTLPQTWYFSGCKESAMCFQQCRVLLLSIATFAPLASVVVSNPAIGQTPPTFSFSAPKQVNVSSVPGNVTAVALAGDLNGDGNTDVLAFFNNGPQVLLGDGNGGFTHASGSAPAGFFWNALPDQNMGLIDLNGDGKLDLWELFPSSIDPSQCGQGPTLLTTWMGDGKGGFGNPVSYQLDPVDTIASTVGDFNNDGKPDFAVYTYNVDGGNCSLPGPTLTILLNNGDGSFAQSGRISGLNVLSGRSVVPLGPQSAAIPNPSTNNSSTTTGFNGMVAGDFNGDGKMDLATTLPFQSQAGNLHLLYGDGKGGFKDGYNYTVDSFLVSFAAADLNGDGKTDLVVGLAAKNAPGALPRIATLLAKQTSGLYWASATAVPNPGEAGLFYPDIGALKDFNGDGKLDVMITNGTASTVQMLILGGLGGGKFAAPKTFTTLANGMGGAPSAIAPFKTGGLPNVFLYQYYATPPPQSFFDYLSNHSK